MCNAWYKFVNVVVHTRQQLQIHTSHASYPFTKITMIIALCSPSYSVFNQTENYVLNMTNSFLSMYEIQMS